MPRKRVHELAKELGIDARYLLARFEELGVHGKKAQSTLTEQEIALVQPGTAQQEMQPAVGQERLVVERVVTEVDQTSDHIITAREEVRESRLSSTLIRRRATRTVLHEGEAPPAEPSGEETSVAVAETPIAAPESFTAPTETSIDFPVVEPISLTAETPLDL